MIVDSNGEADYTSIQECVDAAEPGQSCLVREGRYHEIVTITNKTDIAIKGYGSLSAAKVSRINQFLRRVDIQDCSNTLPHRRQAGLAPAHLEVIHIYG